MLNRGPAPRVGYVLSAFPVLSETFALNELLELRRLGIDTRIYTLKTLAEPASHAEAAVLEPSVRRSPFLSAETLACQRHFLQRDPGRYLRTLATILAAGRGNPRFLSRSLALFPKAVRWARQVEIDGVTHIHAYWASHAATMGWVMAQLTGRPFSFAAHAHDLYCDPTMLEVKLRSAAFVVAISEYNRRLLAQHCPQAAERVHVIHTGTRPERFRVERTNPAPDVPHILFVGRLVEMKGVCYLLAALGLLRDAGYRFRCTVAGAGPLRGRLEAQSRTLGLEPLVRFVGPQPYERLPGLFASADIFALPSVRTRSGSAEGIPVALMEALASGLAAVASDMTGVPELVIHERTGLLISPGDSGALAAALARLIADPALRARLGWAGRQLVEAAFDCRREAMRLAALFRQELPWPGDATVPLTLEALR